MFIIYNKATTLLLGGTLYPKEYETMRGARGGLTRAFNSGEIKDRNEWAIEDRVVFHNSIEKTETVHNLMTGTPVVQPVNTPNCCDPSSETYWTM